LPGHAEQVVNYSYIGFMYTVSQKMSALSCYNFEVFESIWMISHRNVTEKVSNQ